MRFRNCFLAVVFAAVASSAVAQVEAPPRDPMMERRVSLYLENEKLSTIFRHLTELGVNLVLPAVLSQNDTAISITVREQPLGDLMAAIATALHGEWQRHGNIYVFAAPILPFSGSAEPAVAIDTVAAPDVNIRTEAPAVDAPFSGALASSSSRNIRPMSRLLGTVTDAQWERMWKRGYLRWAELSKHQRNLVPAEKRKGRQTFKDAGRRLIVR